MLHLYTKHIYTQKNWHKYHLAKEREYTSAVIVKISKQNPLSNSISAVNAHGPKCQCNENSKNIFPKKKNCQGKKSKHQLKTYLTSMRIMTAYKR